MHRLITVIIIITLSGVAAGAQEPVSPQVPAIVTSGEAIVRRAPDQAFVTVVVESRAKDPREAQRQNAEVMTAVQQRITAAGVARDVMRTLGYTIQQHVDYVNGRRVPREYVARNSLEVRVDAVDRVGEVLEAAVQAGATSVNNIRFELRDRAGAEREALRLAVADARARADAAAAGAGRTVDRVLRIEDSRQPPPIPRPMMEFARTAAAAADVDVPIEAGVIEIRSTVTLTVSIK
jgi:uncharacterized protein YggE